MSQERPQQTENNKNKQENPMKLEKRGVGKEEVEKWLGCHVPGSDRVRVRSCAREEEVGCSGSFGRLRQTWHGVGRATPVWGLSGDPSSGQTPEGKS